VGLGESAVDPDQPARRWTPEPGLRLELDLSGPSLAGVSLGDPAERLAKFGPPENGHPTRDEAYEYRARGFEIGVRDGRVDFILLLWDAADERRHFSGNVRVGGHAARLGARSTEGEVRALLGETDRTRDELGKRTLFYRRGQVEWQADFARGRLTALAVRHPPFLSDD
jgi:hypothetical protein